MPAVVFLPASVGIHEFPVVSAAAVYLAVAHFLGDVAVVGSLLLHLSLLLLAFLLLQDFSTVNDIVVVCWHPCCCHPCCYWLPPFLEVPIFCLFFCRCLYMVLLLPTLLLTSISAVVGFSSVPFSLLM
jgi:hypothetical protein